MKVSSLNQNTKRFQHSAWFDLLARALLLLVLWWWLTDGVIGSWWLGVPVSLAAAFVSMKIRSPAFLPRWRVVPRFAIFFIKHTFAGSVDVARRGLCPAPAMDPAIFPYLTHLQEKPVRLFFITVLGLFPGTLCVAKEGNKLLVHAIDRGMAVETELRRLEELVAELFGVERCGE